jgi:hypothetical protein
VVEVPSGVIPSWNTRAMYRSIFHWRPILNGYSSYWPTGFAERMALTDRLPDARALAALVAQTGLAAVLVNTGERWPKRDAWIALAAADGNDALRLVAREGDLVLFAVRASEATSREGIATPAPADGGS